MDIGFPTTETKCIILESKKKSQSKTLQTSEYELACLRLLSRRAKAVPQNDGPKTCFFFVINSRHNQNKQY